MTHTTMTTTATSTAAQGTCRLTGRVVDATGHPTPGTVVTLTPVPPLPASPGQVPALITPARLDLDTDGRITSLDPATGLARPWADVITGPWTTRVRLTGPGTTWAVDTHLPAGGSVDITTLVPATGTIPDATDPDTPPDGWPAHMRADLDALTTRLDTLTTGLSTELEAVVGQISEFGSLITTRLGPEHITTLLTRLDTLESTQGQLTEGLEALAQELQKLGAA
ncbi:hypothetical protein [Actinomyces faecalis]|uniref:hypothetical protein n=1 Tax=Actinomyces faecalis TaxID=2722820 RepID=UPI001553ADE9|nr:hypothetical protein [Actinomyces faecalis]